MARAAAVGYGLSRGPFPGGGCPDLPFDCHRGRQGSRGGRDLRWRLHGRPGPLPPLRVQHLLKGIAHLAHQMAALSDLNDLRIGCSAGQRIGASAVADQDGHRWMRLPPLRQRLSGASFEDASRLTSFQTHEPRALRAATAKRTRIEAQDTRRGKGESCGALPADKGVGAHPIPEEPGDACRDLGAAGLRPLQEGLPPALRLPGLDGQDPPAQGSTKMRREHPRVSQKNRRAATTRCTGHRPHGTSQGRQW